MVLKPQDVLILLKVALLEGQEWTYPSLSRSLFMSVSEVHAALKRAEAARLVDLTRKTVRKQNLTEFLVHGVKYAYPVQRGRATRGVPTGYAAPPLAACFPHSLAPPPVWPTPDGAVRGYEFAPLYASVPQAAAQDSRLYEMLALVDAVRDGSAREAELAVVELRRRLQSTNTGEGT